ncbi:5323_t:CDS:2, partial [Ambispora leptoticha]
MEQTLHQEILTLAYQLSRTLQTQRYQGAITIIVNQWKVACTNNWPSFVDVADDVVAVVAVVAVVVTVVAVVAVV